MRTDFTVSGGPSTTNVVAQPVSAGDSVLYSRQMQDQTGLADMPEITLGANAARIEGCVFGELTAVRPVGRTSNETIIWLCACSCGNHATAPINRLRNKQVRSCGHVSVKQDLTGQVFGRLTVLDIIPSNQRGQTKWLCRCVCGNIRAVNRGALTTGHTSSCGCGRVYPHGPDNHSWRHDLTDEEREKRRPGYSILRDSVFRRDDYTCQACGRRGVKLAAHHIVPWSKSRELRFEPTNLITLCDKCHRRYHKQTPLADANREQFDAWIAAEQHRIKQS